MIDIYTRARTQRTYGRDLAGLACALACLTAAGCGSTRVDTMAAPAPVRQTATAASGPVTATVRPTETVVTSTDHGAVLNCGPNIQATALIGCAIATEVYATWGSDYCGHGPCEDQGAGGPRAATVLRAWDARTAHADQFNCGIDSSTGLVTCVSLGAAGGEVGFTAAAATLYGADQNPADSTYPACTYGPELGANKRPDGRCLR